MDRDLERDRDRDRDRPALDLVLREAAPRALAALARRSGDFDVAEDCMQEALLAAAVQWPRDGVPQNPTGWLVRVGARRMVDRYRSEQARRQRERVAAAQVPADREHAPPADVAADTEPDLAADDDQVVLLALCCHPALTPASRLALTLRAVGGLSTRQIAGAFLVPEPAMAQRISRAKSRLREVDARFGPLTPAELHDRMAGVLQVLYLIFTEGHTATAGERLYDVCLTAEALRLTRRLGVLRPGDDECAGLLALMLLTDARRAARTAPDGSLIPLAEQDRTRWDRAAIAEAVGILERVLPRGHVGPYQLQAAIAAVHAEAGRWQDTDWPQITALYRMLDRLAPGPAVTVNLAVSVAMEQGPQAALTLLEPLAGDPAMRRSHRLHAVRGHLLERLGRTREARQAYADAARLSTSIPEQRYLNAKVRALDEGFVEGCDEAR
jgi:RNA polymerase sigma factor (sigma-70 family)